MTDLSNIELSSNVLHFLLTVILNAEQREQLDRIAGKARTLAAAKRAARRATADVKAAVYVALDAGVPLSRVAEAAGVQRSLVYHWLDHDAKEAR